MGLGLLERHVGSLLYNIKKPFSYQVSNAYNSKYGPRILVLL